MKKIILTIAVLITSLTSFNSNAQAVKKGDVLVDTYYGVVNLFNLAFKGTLGSVASNASSSSIDHLGVRGEYMLIDKFGIGLDIDFNKVGVSYSTVTTENSNTVVYTYNIGSQNIRSSASFNFHFADSDKLDAYLGLGAGYNYRSYTASSTDAGYSYTASGAITPIAFKLALGMRYFFTDNLGANFAMGIGQGGLVNGGLSFKF